MIIVHYEVYVLEGRGWMLHARFPRPERENALAEAKELEQSLSVRVRVMRETYYTDDNTFEESEIYLSPGAPSDSKPKPPPRPSAAPAPRAAPSRATASPTATPATDSHGAPRPATTKRPAHAPPRSRREQKEAAHARQLLARLAIITTLGLAAALLSIRLAPEGIMLLWRMGFSLTVTPESYNRLLFTIFVITFLMVAVPLAVRFLPRKTKVPRFGSKPHFHLSGGAAPPVDPERDRAIRKSLNKLASEALAEEEGRARPKPEEAEQDDDALPEILPGPEDAALPELRPDPEETPRPPPPPVKETKADTPDKPAEKKARKDGAVTAETLQPTVMKFLDGAIAQAKNLVPNMDAFTKFALHLYMAGAVETLCDFRKLGEDAKAKLVEKALESLGTRGDLARKFYDKLEEYLLEPRYLGVVQAGRDAMGDYMMGDENGAHRPLRDAILEWTRKSDKKAQIVTVMFTDMVGSTDLTQARGDAAAQEVVRRHNSIVRGALAQFGGKEIKHTGDGIMASFATAAAAIEASISIQRQVAQHNQRLPNQALHLRIGLNAGEPIEEEDDLFGATVQLAARVCAATNPDQVLCTGVVKDLTVGKGAASFRAVGEKRLKGFKDAIALFDVQWKS